MINVLLCGICGDMGKKVYISASKNSDINIVCGVDSSFMSSIEFDCPVYSSFAFVTEMVDVVIDFSSPDAIDDVLKFAIDSKCALVVGTMGYTNKQMDIIKEASKEIPIFLSTSISLGVNSLFKLCVSAAKELKDYHIEIIEQHEATKTIAPSRTAILLANAMNEVLGTNKKIIYGRKNDQERSDNEICIHSVRGGGLLGETKIMFIGERETITLTHTVHNRNIFAQGALDIAKFIISKEPNIYNISDYFNK